MKKVILTADDLGRSHERNEAIDYLFKKGLIKSAGLLVTGKYLQDAVNYINSGGYVEQVHLHFNVSGNINGEDSLDKPLTEIMARDKTFCSDGLFLPYRRIPNNLRDIVKWRIVYKELCAQYDKFVLVTKGKGDTLHVDFHLWYNLTWPVAIALNLFTWTHKIKSVRYVNAHQECSRRRRLFRFLLWNPFVKFFRTSNIDGFLNHPEWFEKDQIFELYCHPDYEGGLLMDNTISYFGHEKKTMMKHLELLNRYELEYITWYD